MAASQNLWGLHMQSLLYLASFLLAAESEMRQWPHLILVPIEGISGISQEQSLNSEEHKDYNFDW